MFVATLAYELEPGAPDQALKLLRAELAGRRWSDRYEGKRMPANCVWIRRGLGPGENVDHLLERSRQELYAAVAAVRKMGFRIRLVRAWAQVSGAGTWGLFDAPEEV